MKIKIILCMSLGISFISLIQADAKKMFAQLSDCNQNTQNNTSPTYLAHEQSQETTIDLDIDSKVELQKFLIISTSAIAILSVLQVAALIIVREAISV